MTYRVWFNGLDYGYEVTTEDGAVVGYGERATEAEAEAAARDVLWVRRLRQGAMDDTSCQQLG